MKKYFFAFLVVGALFLTTACGKDTTDDKTDKNNDDKKTNEVLSLTCTKSEVDEDGNETSEKAIIKYNSVDKKVQTVESVSSIHVEANLLDTTLNVLNLSSKVYDAVDGISMTNTKKNDTTIETIISVDYTKLTTESLKNALGDLYNEDNALFSLEEATIDNLKATSFSDYTCE